jgi:hypothetical protein
MQNPNNERQVNVGFGSSQNLIDKEHFYCHPNAGETVGQHGTQRLRLCAGRAFMYCRWVGGAPVS